MSGNIEELENLDYTIINSANAPSLFVDGVTSVIDSGDVVKITFFEDVSSGEINSPSFRRVSLHLALTEKSFKNFVRHINDILDRREKKALTGMTESGDTDDETR